MKISKEQIKRLKIFLAETVLAILGYGWICFTYGSFVSMVMIDPQNLPLAFFLTGQFSFILCLLGYKAYNDWKEDQD